MPAVPTASRTNSSETRRRRSLGQGILAVAASVVFVLGVAGYSILALGYVEGQEFDADSFVRREFSYHEIPLVGWQVSPIRRREITNDLESHLTSAGLVQDLKTPDLRKRWDLVIARRGGVPTNRHLMSQGNARILCEYLDAKDDDDKSVWLEWTKQHPDLARVVWSAVARVARQELYVLVPELFVQARSSTDAARLQEELANGLAARYVAFGRTQQQLNNHLAAVELFSEALAVVPSCAEAFAGRAQSLATLGKKERASADLAQVERLKSRH